MKTLTAKEKKAVAGLLSGKTKRQAIMDAYNCKSLEVADMMGQQVFKRPKMAAFLQEMGEREKELVPIALDGLKKKLEAEPEGVPSHKVHLTAIALALKRGLGEEKEERSSVNFYRQLIKIDNLGVNNPKLPKGLEDEDE